MRRSKEIVVLLALLVAAMAFVLVYVIQRRAANRAAPPRPQATVTPGVPAPAPDVELGGANERKTVDFSTGSAVVKDAPADRAAIDAALKDMHAATKDVTFKPTAPKPAATPAPKP